MGGVRIISYPGCPHGGICGILRLALRRPKEWRVIPTSQADDLASASSKPQCLPPYLVDVSHLAAGAHESCLRSRLSPRGTLGTNAMARRWG